MIRRPPRSTRTDTLFPYTTLFRSLAVRLALEQPPGDHARERLLAPALAAHHFGCLRQPEIAEIDQRQPIAAVEDAHMLVGMAARSEEHTSELQSLMRISYAVFCLKKKKKDNECKTENNTNKK